MWRDREWEWEIEQTFGTFTVTVEEYKYFACCDGRSFKARTNQTLSLRCAHKLHLIELVDVALQRIFQMCFKKANDFIDNYILNIFSQLLCFRYYWITQKQAGFNKKSNFILEFTINT